MSPVPSPFTRFIRPMLLLTAVIIMLGCGSTTTIVAGGPTATATAAATPRPTATSAPPTATPTPGHMLVTITPYPSVCSSNGSSCSPYICHTGTTCNEHGICTASAWPTFTLSNSGGLPVTWNAAVNKDGTGASVSGWTISPPGTATASGTLSSSATASFTLNDNPSTMTGFPNLVLTAPGQTVTVTLSCGIG